MAQPLKVTLPVKITLDTSSARRKLRSLMSLARDANTELARLDAQLEEFEELASELREYGIRLEVN